MVERVTVLDTTLRDGSQMEGISFSAKDKLRIAQKLDELGVAYIEGGWPGSNPKDVEFFQRVRDLDLKYARVAAFASTRRANSAVEGDAGTTMYHPALLARQTAPPHPLLTASARSQCSARDCQPPEASWTRSRRRRRGC